MPKEHGPMRMPPIKVRRLWAHDDGAAAVEMALVLPFALLLLMGIIQFGALFYLQNTMVSVANDILRRVAVGELTEAAAETAAQDRLADWNATFVVDVDEPTANEVRITISAPMSDAAIIDFGHFIGADNVTAQATMRKE
jgi:Flp pilus assembly protein TadG